jgi:hypothetical protein
LTILRFVLVTLKSTVIQVVRKKSLGDFKLGSRNEMTSFRDSKEGELMFWINSVISSHDVASVFFLDIVDLPWRFPEIVLALRESVAQPKPILHCDRSISLVPFAGI